jgi:hypothetical protein
MTALLLCTAAGVLCVAAACVHGYLGETRLIAPARFPNRQAKALVSAAFQLSTALWIASGAVIAAAPWLFDDRGRPWAVAAACLPLLWVIVANAWITRGRHFGWKVFAAVVALAAMGAAA